MLVFDSSIGEYCFYIEINLKDMDVVKRYEEKELMIIFFNVWVKGYLIFSLFFKSVQFICVFNIMYCFLFLCILNICKI